MSRIRPYPSNPKYMVSDSGNVYSMFDRFGGRREKPFQMTPYVGKNTDGRKDYKVNNRYPSIRVLIDGRRATTKIHNMVLETFGEWPRPRGLQCRHIDGDPANNHINNLEWGTAKDNWDDREKHGNGATGGMNGRAILTESDVLEIRKYLSEGFTMPEIGSWYGVAAVTIWHLKHGNTWSHV